ASARLGLRFSHLGELHPAAARRAPFVQRDDGLPQRGLDRGALALPVTRDRVRSLRDPIAVPVVAVGTGRRRALLDGDELVRRVVRRPPARLLAAHSIETTRISKVRSWPANG